jgi:hypothetical protein
MVPRRLRHAGSRFLARRRGERLERDLAALAHGRQTIIAGPWLGEVGFELLYWVPFLRWFAERFAVPADRLLVLSRGGTHAWYSPFAGHYADVFDQVTPGTFRDQHDERVRRLGEQKQTRLTEFDRQLIDGATDALRIGSWALLHPSRMYGLYNPFWWGHLTTEWVQEHARYCRLEPPALADLALPREPYVAMKFYYNECFPPTDRNRSFVRGVIETFASRGPVVALHSGVRIDDHVGERVDASGVTHLPEGLEPARNLLVQSAVVGGAREFVGTYGGFSYLAPFYGVRSTAFYSDAAGFAPRHLMMARDALASIGDSALLRVRDVAEGSGVGH